MLRIRNRDWGKEDAIEYFQRMDSWLFTGPKVGAPIPIFIGQKAPQHGWATLKEVTQSRVVLSDWITRRQKTIYLAQAYSHPDPDEMKIRHYTARVATDQILQKHNVNVFSPIVHSADVANLGNLGHGWDTWGAIDLDWIDRCDELWVLIMNSRGNARNNSKGLQAELAYANMLQKPVKHVNSLGYIYG